MNKNPNQSEQANKDISQIFNPKRTALEVYLDRQNDIINEVFNL